MAGPLDFTGQNIEDTYERIVQTNGTSFFDGTGSAITITGTQNLQQVTDQGSVTTTPITASIISASGNVNVNNLVLPINGKIKDLTEDETYIEFSNNLLTITKAGGDLSLYGQTGINLGTGGTLINTQGQISSSYRAIFPIITSSKVSGFVTNDGNNRILTSNGDGTFNAEQFFTVSNTTIQIQNNNIDIQSQGPLDLRGNINMIGSITASGIIKAREFVSTDNPDFGLSLRGTKTEVTGGLDVTQAITAINITSSGNISASGELIGIIDGGTF